MPSKHPPKRADWRPRQAALNRWTRRYTPSLPAIAVDGDPGPETHGRIRAVKHELGYLSKNESSEWTPAFARQLRARPTLACLFGRGGVGTVRRGLRRRRLLKRSAAGGVAGPRGRAVAWWRAHLGHVEHPAGSNSDPGPDSITHWQTVIAGGGLWLRGLAWCGVFYGMGARAAGAKITARVASVAAIEDDARAGAHGFRSWSTDPSTAESGDAAVLFGRGVHVEGVVSVDRVNRVLHTCGGNTSSGSGGSQANGGGSFPRVRSFGEVHGIAHLNV